MRESNLFREKVYSHNPFFVGENKIKKYTHTQILFLIILLCNISVGIARAHQLKVKMCGTGEKVVFSRSICAFSNIARVQWEEYSARTKIEKQMNHFIKQKIYYPHTKIYIAAAAQNFATSIKLRYQKEIFRNKLLWVF